MTVAEGPVFSVTQKGQATVAQATRPPTQEDMLAFAVQHGAAVTELSIVSNYASQLDFKAIKWPKLTKLMLGCVDLVAVRFTKANTPKLEHLHLSQINKWPPFYLDLPYLRELHVHHCVCGDPKGSFGSAISRCPSLEVIDTYKFRSCDGLNYCVLPNCKRLRLHRSEGTKSLRILHAPKLELVDLQAAYEMDDLRLYDFAAATKKDAVDLNSARINKPKKAALLEEIEARDLPDDAATELPECKIGLLNKFTSLSQDSLQQLRGNGRVNLGRHQEKQTVGGIWM